MPCVLVVAEAADRAEVQVFRVQIPALTRSLLAAAFAALLVLAVQEGKVLHWALLFLAVTVVLVVQVFTLGAGAVLAVMQAMEETDVHFLLTGIPVAVVAAEVPTAV
jgi:hypothetical protein